MSKRFRKEDFLTGHLHIRPYFVLVLIYVKTKFIFSYYDISQVMFGMTLVPREFMSH